MFGSVKKVDNYDGTVRASRCPLLIPGIFLGRAQLNKWQPHFCQLVQLTVSLRADSPFRIIPQVQYALPLSRLSLTWPDPIPHQGKGSGTWPQSILSPRNLISHVNPVMTSQWQSHSTTKLIFSTRIIHLGSDNHDGILRPSPRPPLSSGILGGEGTIFWTPGLQYRLRHGFVSCISTQLEQVHHYGYLMILPENSMQSMPAMRSPLLTSLWPTSTQLSLAAWMLHNMCVN